MGSPDTKTKSYIHVQTQWQQKLTRICIMFLVIYLSFILNMNTIRYKNTVFSKQNTISAPAGGVIQNMMNIPYYLPKIRQKRTLKHVSQGFAQGAADLFK